MAISYRLSNNDPHGDQVLLPRVPRGFRGRPVMTVDQEADTLSRYQRVDARAKATGATRYVGDLSLPGLAHAAMARSTVAHARIRSINVSAARAVPGVIGVFTAADVSGEHADHARDSPGVIGV